jgi:hypothetical protein
VGYAVSIGDDLFAFAESSFSDTELRVDVTAPPGEGIQLRLHQIRELKAVEPWPALQVAWRTKHLELDRTLVPSERRFGSGGPTQAQLAHERMVTDVIARLRANPRAVSIAIDEGWAAFPVVPWAPVEGFPADAPGAGAFRTAADTDPVVARRAPPTPIEKLLIWIASSPERRLVDTPGEAVLTREHLYARFSGGAVRRLPRHTLRTRKGPADEDAVYVFGRRTQLVLPHREGCLVRAALDEQLAVAT